jgi:hypothetical protein
MSAKYIRCIVVALVVVSSACVTLKANGQCCGSTTTAYYQPAAYTAYSPAAYTTYSTGWYPGYFLDRIRARLWGAPSTYVAAYPSTYVASYPSTYVASYPTTAYYASYPSYTTSYSTCSTCVAAPQVTLRPVCTTCCDPCTSCTTGASYGVSQTSYESPAGCACGVPSSSMITTEAQPGMPNGSGAQPELPSTYESTPRGAQKPSESFEAEPEPDPSNTNSGAPEETQESTSGDSGALLEAPELFGPNGRTARRSAAPVRTALYEQPVSHRRVSSAKPTKITAEQAARDAAGWRSASK